MKVYKQAWFWLLVGIVLFLINQLPFLTDMRPVMYDEAWYANTGYNFSQGDGFLNTVVGTRGNSNYLLPTLTGIMFWIFGYSLFTIRLTAVLCGVITMIFLHLCLKELKSSVKAEIAVLAFFVSIAAYNSIFRYGRPECASIMCMTGGVWYFLRYIRENNWSNMIGFSCFAFLSAIAHPYSLLFFALGGAYLFFQSIRDKKWLNLVQLFILLMFAILAIGSIAWVSYVYNGEGENYLTERFSVRNIAQALPVYFKAYVVSKHTIYMLPIAVLTIYSCWFKETKVRVIACITVIYGVIFPFLFSTDLMMVELGSEYVMLLGTLLIAPLFDSIATLRNWKVAYGLYMLYCVANLGLSNYYNYKIKYEKCNSVLAKELRELIPQDAIVFTPIRQYPALMKNRCYSDHSWTGMPASFDYVIMNSQDKDVYYNSVEVQKALKYYEQIYERKTKQYGTLAVYKNNKVK